MKECCSSCGYCRYDKDYTNPYQCRYGKHFKRMNEDEAYNNKCENWCIERSVNQNKQSI